MSEASFNSSFLKCSKRRVKNFFLILVGMKLNIPKSSFYLIQVPDLIRLILRGLQIFTMHLYEEIHCLEQIFIRMAHVYCFVCQLFFFTMIEIAFPDLTIKKDERVVSGLTSLLFYSVIGYFVGRLKEIYMKNWRGSNMGASTLRNFLFWMAKVVMEILKASIVVICLREQGMKYKPRIYSMALTFTYYICTENIFMEIFRDIITYFNFEIFESLEHLIVPIAMNIYTLLTGSFVILKLLFTPDAKYALLASYFVIYLRLKDLLFNYINVLKVERETYASFRPATERDILDWDDICAVCLNRMSRARITPCNHLFHPNCLKQCLKSSYQCPLCKRDFIK